jgi:UDP-2,3-diacylglucosamine pyrophosphatase LpxH
MQTRVCIPDSHGSEVDLVILGHVLRDIRRLHPREIVLLGDHVDAGGFLSKHAPLTREDLEYSYARDIQAANEFLDALQAAAPGADIRYLEGNHEWHAERWAVQHLANKVDADLVIDTLAPHRLLRLRERGIRFYRQHVKYQGIAIPNTIRLGRCYFTHGTCANKFATATHLAQFGENVVHGHTHRVQSFVSKTIRSESVGAWCPGTLAQLQPTYLHTAPSGWTHGYAVQFVNKSGRFLHVNVPVMHSGSLLRCLAEGPRG